MRLYQLSAILAVALVAACGAQPTQEDYDDIATGVSALMSGDNGGDLEAFRDTTSAARGDVPAGLSRSGSGKITGKRASLDYEFDVTCRDSLLQTQVLCDQTTDSARLTVQWFGEIDTARIKATLARTGDWEISGLQSDTAEFNGNGTFDVDSEFTALFRPVTRTLKLDYDASYDKVQVRMADLVIVGGDVHYEIHAKRTKTRGSREFEREFDVSADLTFDGENTANLVLDGERRYRVNLDTTGIEKIDIE